MITIFRVSSRHQFENKLPLCTQIKQALSM
jgi:hypothetical protein